MSDESLKCPFCQKKVGLAGMYVAHIIECGKTKLAQLQAAVDEAREHLKECVPIIFYAVQYGYRPGDLGQAIMEWLAKYGGENP